MHSVCIVLLKFLPGEIVQTPGAQEAFDKTGDSPLRFLLRHLQGDWGDVDWLDKRANDDALRHGTRLLSAYHLSDGTKLWVITEWDRSATTFLLPEEY